MKLSTLPLAALVALSATAPLAAQHKHEHAGPHFRINQDHDGPARPGPRYTPSQAQMYLNTRDDVASLFLTRDVVALQLSERTLRRVSDQVESEGNHDGFFARMIVDVVHNTVNNVLRRSLQIPLDELRSADYRDGRLILIDNDGDEVFHDVEIEDRQVMDSFTPRDAQLFVRQFRALKAARH
jgi:hypothetical protein